MVKLHASIVLQEDGEELYKKHVEEWQQLYQQGSMDIEGNLELVSGMWSFDCYVCLQSLDKLIKLQFCKKT